MHSSWQETHRHPPTHQVRRSFGPNLRSLSLPVPVRVTLQADCEFSLGQFSFFDPPDDDDDLSDIGVSDEQYIAHSDPFYAECRAYGCIERNRQNGAIAVRCYGFMAVSAEREEELAAPPFDVDPGEWNRPEEEYEWPGTARQPFRAIVKELVRSKKRLSRVAQMRDDLLALHEMGIYVQDIHQENYVKGKLVDFSRSWTHPHMMLDPNIRSQSLIDREIEGDLLAFDRMLEEAGVRTRLKALSGSSEPGRLRSKIKKPDRFGF
jgi:Kinetochore Sim4 complex subunit FTA2